MDDVKRILSDPRVKFALGVTIFGIVLCAVCSMIKFSQKTNVIIGLVCSMVTLMGGTMFSKAYTQVKMELDNENKQNRQHK